jgi:hypothetical protein
MRQKTYLFIAIILGLALVGGWSLFLPDTTVVAKTAPERTQVILAALDYLRAQQQADGGVLGFSGASDPDTTARSLLAFAAAGEPASGVVSAQGNSMLDYLSTQAISFTRDTTGTLFPGRAGLLLTAISLAGNDPADFGGMDLAGELVASFHPDTSAYSTTAQQDFSSGQASDFNQAWAILGLSLAGQHLPDDASQYLVESQSEDGSWGFDDPDTTALAMTALLTSRQVTAQDQAIQKALAFFHATQAASGGWKPAWDTEPLNADSTGWILQALISAGEDPTGQSWTIDKANPVDALLSLQKPDGSIGGTYANTYSTAEAIIGLSGMPFSDLRLLPSSHQAGLAVFYGDGSVFTACVSFTESSISGLELLQRTGLSVETATNPNQGTAVCKIGDVGNSSSNCFGSMPNYWSYFQWGENGWEYSTQGADQIQVVDGNVNAWNWGTGNPPAVISYQNICEGVPFVLPAATPTTLPTKPIPQPTEIVTAMPAINTAQPTPQVVEPQSGPGTYLVYACILVVLIAFVIYIIISRRK